MSRFTFAPRAGTLAMTDTPFVAGVVQFQCDEITRRSDECAWTARRGGWVARSADLEFIVKTSGGRLSVGMKNRGRKVVTLRTIQIAFDPARQPDAPRADEYLEFIHSQSFESASGVKKVGLPGRQLAPNPPSFAVYVLAPRNDGKAMLFSTLPPHAGDFVVFRALHDALHMEGRFGLMITSTQDRQVKPGASASVSPIQAVTGPDPVALLDRLGRAWARRLRNPLKPIKVGWNSWGYYAGAVTSKNMRDNQRAATKDYGGRIRYFVIDEGWEPRWGAWVANWKFPDGTRSFCRRVKAEGGVPGIWTAPLLVNTYTDLYREQPDWFLRNSDGSMTEQSYAYGPMAYLDITHPKVERWLHDLYVRLRADGFEYFKVDFTQEILRGQRWADPAVPRGMLIRRAFETIRRAIGPESYLLACGAPYESVMGIVDAVRAAGDIHNHWGHVLTNAAALSARWWTHRRVWNIDPDFLIVRAPETCTLPRLNREKISKPHNPSYPDYWLTGRDMNLREVRAYALLVYLSAGDIFLSDELMTLNAAGKAIVRRVLERPLPNAAVPLDLFGGHDSLPAFWLAEDPQGWFLGVFNWGEDAVQYVLDFPDMGIRNHGRIESFWERKTVTVADSRMLLELPPRSAEGFRIARK